MARLIALLLCLLPLSAWAEGVKWEYDTTKGPIPSTVTLKKAPNSTGPWTTVATIPALPSTYTFPYPPDNQWYTVVEPGGVSSNALNYYPLTVAYDDSTLKKAIADLSTVVNAALTELDRRLDALEAAPTPTPTPTSRVLTKSLSETQLEVSCVTGTRPTQQLDATGLNRIITCP